MFIFSILKSKRSRKGSLLLEALLSIVILSTSLTVIIQAMTSSLRATVYSAEYTRALVLLEDQFFGYFLEGHVEDAIQEKLPFPYPNQKFSYTLDTQNLESYPNNHLNEMRFGVSWKSGQKDNKIVLTTFLMRSGDISIE